jgi:hypothetical protein
MVIKNLFRYTHVPKRILFTAITSTAIALSFSLLSSCGSKNGSTADVSNTSLSGDAKITLGKGYNSLSGEVKGQCVDTGGLVDAGGKEPDSGNTSTSQTVKIEIKDITSLTSLREQLNISTAASFKAFGGNGGSAKMSFAKEVNFNSESRYLLISSKVINATLVEKSPTFTKDVQEGIASGKLVGDAFLKYCGNEYVYSTTTGGEFIAVLEFSASSLQESQRLDASLKASYGAFSGSANISKAIERLAKNSLRQINIYRAGGKGEVVGPDDFEKFAKEFPSKVENTVSGSPTIVEINTRSYDGVGPSALQPNTVGLAQQEQLLKQMGAEFEKAIMTRNGIQSILMNAEKYEAFDAVSLQQSEMELKEVINKLNTAAIGCFENYKNCAIPDYSFPVINRPQVKPAPEFGDTNWKQTELPNSKGWSLEFPMLNYISIGATCFNSDSYLHCDSDVPLAFDEFNGVFEETKPHITFQYSTGKCESFGQKYDFLPLEGPDFKFTGGYFERYVDLNLSIENRKPLIYILAEDKTKNECIALSFFRGTFYEQKEQLSLFGNNIVSKRILKIVKSLKKLGDLK